MVGGGKNQQRPTHLFDHLLQVSQRDDEQTVHHHHALRPEQHDVDDHLIVFSQVLLRLDHDCRHEGEDDAHAAQKVGVVVCHSQASTLGKWARLRKGGAVEASYTRASWRECATQS